MYDLQFFMRRTNITTAKVKGARQLRSRTQRAETDGGKNENSSLSPVWGTGASRHFPQLSDDDEGGRKA